ncbi:hypothetical protein JRO89_XS15G0059900 [Xanthoceras sorbifolium]|uniref:Uncharacterized protein n=1 Tax=Xanthoceras sorbifolium TaxID=99658 RepID=A0ABQ8H120_9ROSI|nr:hypothetical protein JRO89_XS15G0059900 [Xanthoceras sorbifolium]
MAGGVNSAVQRRQVRRKRRPSRPKEAESARVSTLETIRAEQPTTASCSVFVLLQYIAVSILKSGESGCLMNEAIMSAITIMMREAGEALGFVKGSHERSSKSSKVQVMGSLQKVAEEESSLRSLVESLKLESENVKKEHFELKEKEAGSRNRIYC